ncbi:MAG: hypothetical protein GY710_17880 [Desulfobacteraceae bacterium]|nr:hypothetical protein [Desulfobacteraceae bacterium]
MTLCILNSVDRSITSDLTSPLNTVPLLAGQYGNCFGKWFNILLVRQGIKENADRSRTPPEIIEDGGAGEDRTAYEIYASHGGLWNALFMSAAIEGTPENEHEKSLAEEAKKDIDLNEDNKYAL